MAEPVTSDLSILTESNGFSEFERLERFVRYHLGHFSLGLVRVNHPGQRNSIISALAQLILRDGIYFLRLDLSNLHPVNLHQAIKADSSIRDALNSRPDKSALAVIGMEHLVVSEAGQSGRRDFAAVLNTERETIRAVLPVPLLLFLTDHAMDQLDLSAPDFFDWYSAIFNIRPVQEVITPTTEQENRKSGLPTNVVPSSLSDSSLAQRLELLEERRNELARNSEKDGVRLGQVLLEIGEIYADWPTFQNRQMAAPYLKKAAQIFHGHQEKASEAAALSKLGEVCYWIDDYRQSYRRYSSALPIYREIGDRLGEANCIKALGDVHQALSELPQARQRYEEALPIYREIGDRLGEANTYTGFGDLSLSVKEYDSARSWYEKSLKMYLEIGERIWQTYVGLKLGQVLQASGETDMAAQILAKSAEITRSIESKPNLGSIIWTLAQVQETQENYSAALDCINELLASSPENVSILYQRAHLLYELNDYQGAFKDYSHLVKLNPQDAWALNGVANVLEERGEHNDALEYYGLAIAANSNQAAFYRNRANLLIKLDRLDEAQADCEAAARLAPDEAYTLGRWGELHLARGDCAQAETVLRRALEDDNSPGWRFSLAVALWGLGRTQEGWDEFNTAIQVADDKTCLEASQEYSRLFDRHIGLPVLLDAINLLINQPSTP